jgi:hypothetical protein
LIFIDHPLLHLRGHLRKNPLPCFRKMTKPLRKGLNLMIL